MREQVINQTLQKNFHSNETWNSCLSKFKNTNIFQCYEWGELKKSDGWEVLHITITNNENLELTLAAQVLIKKFFGIKIAWCPGGPLVETQDLKNAQDALQKFKDIVIEENIFNLRCKPYIVANKYNESIFSNFIKPNTSLTSSKTNILKVVDEETFLSQVKKKHRYYIKQSQKQNITWETFVGEQASVIFLKVYNEMKKHKNINLPIINIGKFSSLLGERKDGESRVFTYAGLEGETPVSVCLISIFQSRAFYHYAASTERGRSLSASYGMIFNLMRKLDNMQISELDFGGLSEDGSSSGVDFFKKGFNGNNFQKLGEFDISKSKLHSYLFNKVLEFKNKIKRK